MKVNTWRDQQESFLFMNEEDSSSLVLVKPPFDSKELFRLAAQGIYIGTSSWKYRGWEGMIYKGGYSSEAQFQRQSLREYTSHLPCVGVDFTFYTWPMADMMNYLVESTPENFRMCPKVTKRITMDTFPNIPSYGKWAGQENPDFLNAELFMSQFLQPVSILGSRLGGLFFEFSNLREDQLPKLQRFFEKLPRNVPLSIEIRNPELVNKKFYSLLRALKLSPAFNSWSRMPLIRTQWEQYRQASGDEDGAPLFIRALLRPGRSYEDAVRMFQPYKELKEIFTEVRQDIATIIRQAKATDRKLYVFINNRLEGSAPHTIGGIVQNL